ncbi:MAG: 8-oxo-dGTP diphosphatase [Candidatus Doudnabacteria bacterium]|nr:8-oxo-dGTP diphosphatase [Candidatus Doudnabacteria bacterium]
MDTTVCSQIYLLKQAQVSLPLKKRGFGAGWHNGYGGKVESGESIEQSAIRELKEEAGVVAKNVSKRAVLTFNFINSGKKTISHIYWCEDFAGEPVETEEMQPFWFKFAEAPYEKMWPDDKLWFPKFLAGEKFEAEFEFLDDKPTIGKYNIKNVDYLSN